MTNRTASVNRALEHRLDRRTFIKVAGALGGAAIMGLAGCQGPSAAPPSATSAPGSGTPKPAPFKAAIGAVDFLTISFYIPYFVSEAKGYFAEEGLQHETVNFATAGDMQRAIESGECHYAMTSASSAANAILKGAPSVIVGGVNAAAGAACYLVPPESPIKSLKDIKGKKLGFPSPGGYTHNFTIELVRKAGYTLDEVKLVSVGGSAEAWAATLSGAVDAGWAGSAMCAKMVMEGKARVPFTDLDAFPVWQGQVFTTSKKFVSEHGDVLRRFLRAYQKGCEFVWANPDETLKIWTSHPQAQFSLEVAKKTMEMFPMPLKTFTAQLSGPGLRANEPSLVTLGVIKEGEKLDWNKVIDQSFLREDLRIDLSKI